MKITSEYRNNKLSKVFAGLFAVAIVAMAMMGCGGAPGQATKKTMTKEAYLSSLDSAGKESSLVTVSTDTVFAMNPELLMLLDTLYQHVRSDSFPSEVRTEEEWMAAYRTRLSSYYDAHGLGSDTLSVFAKAETVIDEGLRLLKQNSEETTMGMIEMNTNEFTFDRCKEYGLLSQLISKCESQETKDLVYREWSIYERLASKMSTIASDIASLSYWGGSIVGPLSTLRYVQVSDARREMYAQVIGFLERDDWDGTGIYLDCAGQVLMDCCTKTVMGMENHGMDNEDKERFAAKVKETEGAIRDLRPLLDEWTKTMDKLDETLTSDGTRHYVERAGSMMLIKWASMVSGN